MGFYAEDKRGLWTIQTAEGGRWKDRVHVTRRAAVMSFEAMLELEPKAQLRVLNDRGEPIVGVNGGPPHGDVNAAA